MGRFCIESESVDNLAFPAITLVPPAEYAVLFYGFALEAASASSSHPPAPPPEIEARAPPPDASDPTLPNNSLPADNDLIGEPADMMPDASGGMAGIRFVGVTREQCPQ